MVNNHSIKTRLNLIKNANEKVRFLCSFFWKKNIGKQGLKNPRIEKLFEDSDDKRFCFDKYESVPLVHCNYGRNFYFGTSQMT